MNKLKARFLNIKVDYLVYILLIILPIYKDSPLQRVFGVMGETLIPIVGFGLFIVYLLSGRKFSSNQVIHRLFLMGGYLLFISCMALSIWTLLGKETVLYGEVLFIKIFKVLFQYLSYLVYLLLLFNLMGKLTPKEVFYPIIFVLFLLTLICFIEYFELPYAFGRLHTTGVMPYNRIRLLTKESSWTTMLIFNYSLLSVFFAISNHNALLVVLTVLSTALLILLSGAKSLMILFAIFIVLSFVYLFWKYKKYRLLICAVSIFLIFVYSLTVGPRLWNSLFSDIQSYTSVATRGYSLFLGILLGLLFPLGVGGGIYLGVLSSAMERCIGIFRLIPVEMNLEEIYFYINAPTDMGLSVKSGLLQYNIYWGIFGTIIFLSILFSLMKKLSRKDNNIQIIRIGFICNIIMLLFFMDFSFEFWLFVAIIMYLIKIKDKKDIRDNNYNFQKAKLELRGRLNG